MGTAKRATSRDVARLAGVSQSAVSMILSGRGGTSFSEATVQRVHRAAKELGYTGSSRSRTVMPQGMMDLVHGAVVIISPVMSNPYYSVMCQAIERAARANGYSSVVFTTYRSPDYERRLLEALRAVRPGGIIFTNSPDNVSLTEEIGQLIPVVVIGDRNSSIGVDTVEVNSFLSGSLLAEHLASLGHRSVAFLSTTLNNTIRCKRLEGVKSIFDTCGGRVVVKSRSVTTAMDISDPDIEHKVGYELTLECLRCEDVTAFVGVNDMVCYGILTALADMRRRVPDEYSVCGFDNIFPSALAGVTLTSVENHILQKGENAFQMLLRRMKAPGLDDDTAHVEFPPRLVLRASTGPVPRRSDTYEAAVLSV